MLSCKEIKGTIQNPDIDEDVNAFFDACDEDIEILNMYYTTSAVPYKTKDGVGYQLVSSCLIFYSCSDEEGDAS